MTVGITIHNGLEGIVVTDSRGTLGERHTDAFTKMFVLENQDYSGVIYGSGNSSLLDLVFSNVEKKSTINDVADNIKTIMANTVNSSDKTFLEYMRNEFEKKSLLIENPDERSGFLRQKISESMQEYGLRKEKGYTVIILTGIEKTSNKIKNYLIDANHAEELSLRQMSIGSGSDGANMYLMNKLQGIDTTKLNASELAFFAMNAYSSSTINGGVGGTPKMALVSKDKTYILPQDKTIALANVSGAHLSEYPGLGTSKTIEIFDSIMNKDIPDYGSIASTLDIGPSSLKTLCCPYSSWQERSNRILFSR